MSWYSVRVLFCAKITGEPEEIRLDPRYHADDFYEENILLMQASSAEQAAKRAENHCRNKEKTYLNRYNQQVEYKFYDWLQVDELKETEIVTGTTVMNAVYRMPKGADVEEIIDRQFSPCGSEDLFPLHHLNTGL